MENEVRTEVQENKVVEVKQPNKKGNGLGIIIIILVLIILGLGGFIVYDKFIKNDKPNNTEEKENKKSKETPQKETATKPEELDVESSKVQELYYNANNHGIVGIDETKYNTTELKVSAMDDNYKIQVAYNIFKKDIKEKNEGTYTIETVSEDSIKTAVEKIFGKDTYKQVESFRLHNCATYKYNSTNKIYEAITGGCGGTTSFFEVSTAIKATKYDDRIEIVSGAVFIDIETKALYKDYGQTSKIKDLTEDEMTNTLGNTYETKFIPYIKENPEKVGQYTYTFKLADDGSYYYTGVKNTK